MTICPTPAPTPPAQGTRKGYPYHIRSVHLTMNGVAQPRRMVGALAGALAWSPWGGARGVGMPIDTIHIHNKGVVPV